MDNTHYLPMLIAYALPLLPWITGSALGLAVLWSPPVRSWSARLWPQRLTGDPRELDELRARLEDAMERIETLEASLLENERATLDARRLLGDVHYMRLHGKIPTPV